MIERQTIDLEVRGSNPGPGRFFLLKSKTVISQGKKYVSIYLTI